jgi:hypothetical protein
MSAMMCLLSECTIDLLPWLDDGHNYSTKRRFWQAAKR